MALTIADVQTSNPLLADFHLLHHAALDRRFPNVAVFLLVLQGAIIVSCTFPITPIPRSPPCKESISTF